MLPTNESQELTIPPLPAEPQALPYTPHDQGSPGILVWSCAFGQDTYNVAFISALFTGCVNYRSGYNSTGGRVTHCEMTHDGHQNLIRETSQSISENPSHSALPVAYNLLYLPLSAKLEPENYIVCLLVASPVL
jgi:hypothetical protein